MGRIIPNREILNRLHQPLTSGEWHLINQLDKILPKDPDWKEEKDLHLEDNESLNTYKGWIIFAQPYLNGSRPDIIIFNPFVGLAIFEVKDWNLDSYSLDGNRLKASNSSNKNYSIKSPYKQANFYKDLIIGQLISKLGELADQDKKKYGLIKAFAYFHIHKRQEAIKFFTNWPQSNEKELDLMTLGFDSISSLSNLGYVFKDAGRSQSSYWPIEINKELLFWLRPPKHTLDQGVALTLKADQRRVADPKSGHYRARGVAGSGKTQALAYRAGNLAGQGKKVLILTYNITLWHYIKDMVQRSPFEFEWSQIQFDHFHGFCQKVLNAAEVDWPSSKGYDLDKFFNEIVPQAVHNALNHGFNNEDFLADAILIDEGQDYCIDWYQLLNRFLTSRDELLVVCDKKQNIYQQDLSWLDKRVNGIVLQKFQSEWQDLKIVYRIPPKLARVANAFSKAFGLNQEVQVAGYDKEGGLFETEHLIWFEKAYDPRQLIDFSFKCYLSLVKKGNHPSDIIFLVPSHSLGLILVQKFEENGINVNHVIGEDDGERKRNKKSFWMGDSRLKICTLHSFKGWELHNVVVIIPPDSQLPFQKEMDMVTYTAITRTKQNLVIINCNKRYSEFGSRFPKTWERQDYQIPLTI